MKNIRIAQVLAMVFSIGAISIAPQPAWAQTSETYSPVPKKLDYDIRYFIPNTLHAAGKTLSVDDKFLPEVPQPQSVLGFEVGEQYADWNDVLKYMEALHLVMQEFAEQLRAEYPSEILLVESLLERFMSDLPALWMRHLNGQRCA